MTRHRLSPGSECRYAVFCVENVTTTKSHYYGVLSILQRGLITKRATVLGRNGPASWTLPWDYTHTRQQSQAAATQRKHDYSPPALLTGVGKGPLQNRVWPVRKANLEASLLLQTQEPKNKGEAGRW